MIKTHECYYPLYNDKEHFVILVTGGRGCEHPDTPVMMADFSVKPIKDIKVGDRVMGVDFKPRNVLGTTKGTSMMYRVHHKPYWSGEWVELNDYIVNDSHILTLENVETDSWVNINIRDYLALSVEKKEKLHGIKQYYDDYNECQSVEIYPEIEVTAEGEGEYCGIFLDGDHRYLHSDGVVTHNSGKSYSVGTFLERLTFEKNKLPDGSSITHNILSTRYTLSSAAISVIPEFLEKVEADGTEKYFYATKTDVTNVLTGAKVMFRGIKTSSGNQTAKLKSIQGITTFVCDEAEEWTNEEEFEKIMFSIRQQGIQNRIIIIMNPTDSNHFIYQKYIKDTHKIVEYDGVPVQISTHPNVLHIHTSYLDNMEHLSDEFLREAQLMKENNPERYAHIFMGQWSDVAEGAVFKKWGIVDEFPEQCKRQGFGLDFGFTQDPTACVRCGIIGDDLYLDEEFYEKGLLSNEISRRLAELTQFRRKVIADSADPRLIQEIANHKVLIYPVMKGAGSILAGIDKMNTMNIYVTRRSLNLQEELRNYTWDKDKDGHYINQPIDAYNHALDAARYWVLGELLGQIVLSNIDKSKLSFF